MSFLLEKLLLEEALFEDSEESQVDDTAIEDETTEEDEIVEPEITDDNLDQVVQDVETDTQTVEPVTTTYKVTFTLGKHTNWSRVTTTDEEDAKQQVTDYVTKKWPDREFEITEVEEFNEEELEEELNESLTDAQPIETGASVGMASVISDLIKDEYEAIDGYNSAIATAEAEGFTDMISVLTEIQAEENLHIGQLQAIMNTLDPNSHLIDDGQQEGAEQLANPLGNNEVVEESLKEDIVIGRPDYSVDMSDEEYEEFRDVLTQHYGSPAAFFKRLHSYRPDFEIHNVDYEELPDDCITLSSSDISQGTGNVIVYTVMDRNTGKIYRYADF